MNVHFAVRHSSFSLSDTRRNESFDENDEYLLWEGIKVVRNYVRWISISFMVTKREMLLHSMHTWLRKGDSGNQVTTWVAIPFVEQRLLLVKMNSVSTPSPHEDTSGSGNSDLVQLDLWKLVCTSFKHSLVMFF